MSEDNEPTKAASPDAVQPRGGANSAPPASKTAAPFSPWLIAAGALALALIALGYVGFVNFAKPEPQGLARFAKGAMNNLAALEAPPEQPLGSLQDSEGHELTLAAFHGQLTLVNIWATWCGPCRAEMPTLGALQQRFADRGLKVVAVSIDSASDWDKAKAMLADLGHGALQFYVDPSKAIAFDVDAPGMPTTILYDRDGKERARLTGGADWSSPEAAALIEAALADQPQ